VVTTASPLSAVGLSGVYTPTTPATGYSNENETGYFRRGCGDYEATWFLWAVVVWPPLPPRQIQSTVVDETPRHLQLDIQMKTKFDIHNEVVEILKRRGFELWWSRGPTFSIKRNRSGWLPRRRTCNGIEK